MRETTEPARRIPKRGLLLAVLCSVFVTALVCVSAVVALGNCTHSIVGTFLSGGNSSLTGEYFAFTTADSAPDTDGLFYFYRQNELMDEGRYIFHDDGVCSLYGKDSAGVTMEVVFANDNIYRINSDGLSAVYSRIASEPMLINISDQVTVHPS